MHYRGGVELHAAYYAFLACRANDLALSLIATT